MEQKLTQVFALVNEWLRYAEAKNGALAALAAAALATVSNVLATAAALTTTFKVLGVTTAVCFAFSCSIALLSFVPLVNRPKLSSDRKGVNDAEKDNLLFFGDLCKYTPTEFLDSMTRRYFEKDEYVAADEKYYLDLAEQIIVNSRITAIKFRFFKVGVWFLIAAIPLGLVSLLYHVVIN
jgi:hypothetical protein